ncbi:hypothetical protein [Clostridium manihotivorum]|uniref:PET hydrolase/cutinase-like domain-containing protein n=1 Tax=Clostridium manihotivorum TaxID=2320868 RepID=A0A410DYU7_9CLOT|nr:hypothetical protein [Clostridium manihotivorum]QAA34247.1 hypothetical protein C1I91_22845 [Clostridium manihotivorum]
MRKITSLRKVLASLMIMLSVLVVSEFGVQPITALAASAPIVRSDEVPGAYTGNGPYSYSTYSLPTSYSTGGATVYYPTSYKAIAPFSALVYCPPYTATQIALAAWGPFFASHGIVLVTFDTTTIYDTVESRAAQQKTILNTLKAENTRIGSPLYGKLATDRIGAMGWSMGGGATWINSAEYPGLKTAMTLAGHNLSAMDMNSRGVNTKCPTLIMNGAMDMTYLGGMGQSIGVYSNIPVGVPKIIYEVASADHFSWTTPTYASPNVAVISLAFQKTYLDGDARWAKYITRPSINVATWQTSSLKY